MASSLHEAMGMLSIAAKTESRALPSFGRSCQTALLSESSNIGPVMEHLQANPVQAVIYQVL